MRDAWLTFGGAVVLFGLAYIVVQVMAMQTGYSEVDSRRTYPVVDGRSE